MFILPKNRRGICYLTRKLPKVLDLPDPYVVDGVHKNKCDVRGWVTDYLFTDQSKPL